MPIINVVNKESPAERTADTGRSPAALSSRERAINAMIGNQKSSSPVQDATRVSPEELGAIQKPSQSEPGSEIADASTALGQRAINTEQAAATAETAPTPEAQPKEQLSAQYAQLARQEKALRAKAHQQEQAFKAREEALKLKESQYTTKDQEYSTKYISKDQLKTDTFNALAEAGIDYNELTNRLISQPAPQDMTLMNEIKSLKSELQAMKGEQEGFKKQSVDSQNQAYQQALTQIRMETQRLVKGQPEQYEMISATNSVSDVVELIEETYNKGLGDDYPKGTVLPVDIAAQLVEDHLLEEAEKISKISKFRKKFLTPGAQDAPSVSNPPQQQGAVQKKSPEAKTLTNAMSSQRPMSARERAISAFKGELKR